MAINLVVQIPFWHYERGSTISDPAEMEKVVEHHSHFVTQVMVPDETVDDSVDLQTRLGPEK